MTEELRKMMTKSINTGQERMHLEEIYGKVWNTKEVTRDFSIHGFMAPFVSAKKRDTGEEGTLIFQDYPRFYFEWNAT